MQAWFSDLIAQLTEDPLLQGVLAALSTFILEDPTTVGCGLLVADGRMTFRTAFLGVSAGIAVGDLGLYAIGRLGGPNVVRWGWVTQTSLDRATGWFRRNVTSAVLLSRFVPGTRLLTYVAAGMSRAPFLRFLLVVVIASVVWTAALMWLVIGLGELVLPILGRARWPLALAAIGCFVYLQRRAARRLVQAAPAARPVASAFEFWRPWFFYLPVGVYYLWLALRFRSPLLPSAANPSIFAGGLIGESKAQILDLVAQSQRVWIAPYVRFSRAEASDSGQLVGNARATIRAAGLDYPLVGKPDVGQRGAGVRPLFGDDDLADYLLDFPPGASILFQELVAGEDSAPPQLGCARGAGRFQGVREAGVLYWRLPGSVEGRIFSITLKELPRVVGDGSRTVRQLIESDARAARLSEVYLKRHAERADQVLRQGEVLPLVFAGNHCQGAVFHDGTALATPQLLQRCHQIACAMPEFYFGRFDVRFHDLDAFLRGEDFRVIEINGAGAEATHIWDATATLPDAYVTLFEQFRILFEIGAANRRRGHEPIGLLRFLRVALAYRRLARRYPQTS
jgi:membrane protein DedA with SNARE-associated domain